MDVTRELPLVEREGEDPERELRAEVLVLPRAVPDFAVRAEPRLADLLRDDPRLLSDRCPRAEVRLRPELRLFRPAAEVLRRPDDRPFRELSSAVPRLTILLKLLF
jgi:hypothetical protein